MAKKKTTTFRDRLEILMDGEKPYAWCKKVGIKKGLFQYYWQKGKLPKIENLLKIRNYTGCSLDWLLTGEGPNGQATATPVFSKRQRDLTEKIEILFERGDNHGLKILESLAQVFVAVSLEKALKMMEERKKAA